jgi:hypothetical protein
MSGKSQTDSTRRTLGRRIMCLLVFLASCIGAKAQTFSSNSDGSDGAYDLTGQTGVVNFDPKQFHGSGVANNVFNFTTITIPAGVAVKLSGNLVNGPVYWLAQGNVDVEGTIDLSGQAGAGATPILDARRRPVPGPGGYSGGVGGKTDSSGAATLPIAQSGDGPGGGAAGSPTGTNCNSFSLGFGGTFTANQFLVPLVGGSGGGGANSFGTLGSTPYAGGGGAGGGAILIASSTTITVNGTINANGGCRG